MKKSFVSRYARIALVAITGTIVLLGSPTTREYIIATAHAAAQKVLVINGINRAVPTTPAEKLFQIRIAVGVSGGGAYGSNTFAVPANRRLVLENIVGIGASPGAALVEIVQSGATAVLLPEPTNTSWKWAATTPTKVVFNPGNVTVAIRLSSASGGASTGNYITLTGYLIRN